MNAELLIIKGAISELPQAEQDKVKVAAEELRAVLAKHPEVGVLAFALVGVQLQETTKGK